MHIIICVWAGRLKAMVRRRKIFHEMCIEGIHSCELFCFSLSWGGGFCFVLTLQSRPYQLHQSVVCKIWNCKSPQNISSSSGICKYVNPLFSREKMVCCRWILDVNSKQVDRAAGGPYQAFRRGPTPYSCRKWIMGIGGKGSQICQAEYL